MTPEARRGTQAERTYLSWQRTGLAFIAVGALLMHGAGGLDRPIVAAAGLLSLATGATIMAGAFLRYRTSSSLARARSYAAPRGVLPAIAGVAAVLGVLGIAVVGGVH